MVLQNANDNRNLFGRHQDGGGRAGACARRQRLRYDGADLQCRWLPSPSLHGRACKSRSSCSRLSMTRPLGLPESTRCGTLRAGILVPVAGPVHRHIRHPAVSGFDWQDYERGGSIATGESQNRWEPPGSLARLAGCALDHHETWRRRVAGTIYEPVHVSRGGASAHNFCYRGLQ